MSLFIDPRFMTRLPAFCKVRPAQRGFDLAQQGLILSNDGFRCSTKQSGSCSDDRGDRVFGKVTLGSQHQGCCDLFMNR